MSCLVLMRSHRPNLSMWPSALHVLNAALLSFAAFVVHIKVGGSSLRRPTSSVCVSALQVCCNSTLLLDDDA